MPKGYSPIRWEQKKRAKEKYDSTYVEKPKPKKPESVVRSKFSEGGWLSKKLYYTYY